MIFIRQQDSMQCGIACLAMICRNYGKKYTIDALSDICFATTEGVSLLGISQAAKKLGFETTSKRISTERLSKISLPCILHWNQNILSYYTKCHLTARSFMLLTQGKGKLNMI